MFDRIITLYFCPLSGSARCLLFPVPHQTHREIIRLKDLTVISLQPCFMFAVIFTDIWLTSRRLLCHRPLHSNTSLHRESQRSGVCAACERTAFPLISLLLCAVPKNNTQRWCSGCERQCGGVGGERGRGLIAAAAAGWLRGWLLVATRAPPPNVPVLCPKRNFPNYTSATLTVKDPLDTHTHTHIGVFVCFYPPVKS